MVGIGGRDASSTEAGDFQDFCLAGVVVTRQIVSNQPAGWPGGFPSDRHTRGGAATDIGGRRRSLT